MVTRITITAIETRTRIRAYSTIPWPLWRLSDWRVIEITSFSLIRLFAHSCPDQRSRSGVAAIYWIAPLVGATVFFNPAMCDTTIAGTLRPPHAPIGLSSSFRGPTVHARPPGRCSSLFHLVLSSSWFESLRLLDSSGENPRELERDFQPVVRQTVQDPRPDAGSCKPPKNPALRVESGAREAEDVLHADNVLFHAADLADLDDLAAAIPHTLQMHYDVECACNLGSN